MLTASPQSLRRLSRKYGLLEPYASPRPVTEVTVSLYLNSVISRLLRPDILLGTCFSDILKSEAMFVYRNSSGRDEFKDLLLSLLLIRYLDKKIANKTQRIQIGTY
jgi:hypothetical protein